MNHPIRSLCALAAILTFVGAVDSSAQETPRFAAGMALRTVFSPHRAPPRVEMGMIQRSFLDMVEESEPALEIALVVDGTASMEDEIKAMKESLPDLVKDLNRYRAGNVKFALVVFRDALSKAPEVEAPINAFTDDVEKLTKEFGAIKIGSGEPYFHELPDLGVYHALTKLNWSAKENVTKWVFLFGDAPPYNDLFDESETGAKRRFGSEKIVEIANDLNVRLNCVLCSTRDEEKGAQAAVLAKTQQFMSELAEGTDGVILDLSSSAIRQKIVQAATAPPVETVAINVITQEDIDQERAAVKTKPPLQMAVLPFQPLAKMNFETSLQPVQLAAEIRERINALPTINALSPVDVENRFRAVQTPQRLAVGVAMEVDYLVGGQYDSADATQPIDCFVYSCTTNEEVLRLRIDASKTKRVDLSRLVLEKLLVAMAGLDTQPALVQAAVTGQKLAGVDDALTKPLASDAESLALLLQGKLTLQQSLAYAAGESEGSKLLAEAEKHLASAARNDPRNALVYSLLASCHFSQSQEKRKAGDSEMADKYASACKQNLEAARRNILSVPFPLWRDEINADYTLMVRTDQARFTDAITQYQKLAAGRGETALRANWVLAGLYAGDWGAPESVANSEKVRTHIINLMAHWPKSPEAVLAKRQIRWNEEKGQNQYRNYPRSLQADFAAFTP